MKNCPNCGAPIFDNKNQCFACGMDLTAHNNTEPKTDDGFADNFFAQIGGVVSNEQDTVLTSQPIDVSANVNDVSSQKNINNQNVMVVDTQDNNANNDSFNSILGAYITTEETKAPDTGSTQKLFTITKEKREQPVVQEQVVQQPVVNQPVQAPLRDIPAVVQEAYDSQIPKPVQVEQVHVAPTVAESVQIDDEGEFIDQDKKAKEEKKVAKQEEGPKEKPKVNTTLIFNICCTVVFLGMLVFVYFNFLRKPDNTHTELGGLTYEMNSEFELIHENSGSKYYTYKSDNCSVRVSFMAANDDSVLNNFFISSKEHFANDPNYNFQNDSIKINNNTWESLTVIEMPNGSVTAPTLRYKYSAIVYNATFYSIAFVNLNNDDKCTSMYNDFNDSLIFY